MAKSKPAPTTKPKVVPPAPPPTTTVQTTTTVRRGSWITFIAVALAVVAITLATLAFYYPKTSSLATANSSLPAASPPATSNPAPAPTQPTTSEPQRSGIVVDEKFVKAVADAGCFLYIGPTVTIFVTPIATPAGGRIGKSALGRASSISAGDSLFTTPLQL